MLQAWVAEARGPGKSGLGPNCIEQFLFTNSGWKWKAKFEAETKKSIEIEKAKIGAEDKKTIEFEQARVQMEIEGNELQFRHDSEVAEFDLPKTR